MRLLWAVLVGMAMVIFAIGGAWVGATERRISTTETKVTVMEEQIAQIRRTQEAIERDVRAILDLLRATK